jgi:hypothetical protein
MGRDLDGFDTDALLEELAHRRATLAVRHPTTIELQQVADVDGHESIDLVATTRDGVTLTVRATRVTWHTLLMGGPRPSNAESDRDLYLRGVIDAAEFERRLGDG